MAIFDHLTTATLKFWPWSWSKIFDHLTMTPGRRPNGQKIVVILPPPPNFPEHLNKVFVRGRPGTKFGRGRDQVKSAGAGTNRDFGILKRPGPGPGLAKICRGRGRGKNANPGRSRGRGRDPGRALPLLLSSPTHLFPSFSLLHLPTSWSPLLLYSSCLLLPSFSPSSSPALPFPSSPLYLLLFISPPVLPS